MPQEPEPDIFMPWYIMDCHKDTMHLTIEEDCVYRRRLDMHWMTKGRGLPDDDMRLANLARVPQDLWQRVKPALMPYFVIENGVWLSRKNYALYMGRLETMRAASQRGKAAAEARWQSSSSAQAVPEQSQSQLQSESQSNSEGERKAKAVNSEELRPASAKLQREKDFFKRLKPLIEKFYPDPTYTLEDSGGLLRTLMREQPGTFDRVLTEVESMAKEQNMPEHRFRKGPIETLVDLYKRYKD